VTAPRRELDLDAYLLPPGIPFEQQRTEAMRAERGILDLTEEELTADAAAVRSHLSG
jgi:hypothetical protein